MNIPGFGVLLGLRQSGSMGRGVSSASQGHKEAGLLSHSSTIYTPIQVCVAWAALTHPQLR